MVYSVYVGGACQNAHRRAEYSQGGKLMSNNEQEQDLLDIILDEDNKDPIVLLSEKGEQITFEQVAVIPREVDGEPALFVVLKPLDKVEGIADDEAVVFRVNEDEDGNIDLRVVEDQALAIAVFNRYYDLLEEELDKNKRGSSD